MKKTIEQLIEEEYMLHNEEEDDELYWMKEGLKNCLNSIERKIYITYLENETYSATARVFNVSTPTVSKYLNNLKARLIDYVDEHVAEPDDD